jgi:hypothetical protein
MRERGVEMSCPLEARQAWGVLLDQRRLSDWEVHGQFKFSGVPICYLPSLCVCSFRYTVHYICDKRSGEVQLATAPLP